MTLFTISGGLADRITAGDIDISNLVHSWLYIMFAVVFLSFIIGELTRNYSQTDKLWSIMPIVYSWVTVSQFPAPRLVLMAILVTFWGLRLSHNFYRKGGYSFIPWEGAEDYRWKIMRERPELKGRLRFGLFNLLFISFYQHALILMFSSPLLLAALNSEKGFSVIDLLATLGMLSFILTETIADNQLFRFHKEKSTDGKGEKVYTESLKKGFMTEGLWKYVRHPNFASEQAIWISFYFFGVAASGIWINITLTGPVLLVLLFIGSTQLTEQISSGKYPEYNSYRKDVPKFIPKLF